MADTKSSTSNMNAVTQPKKSESKKKSASQNSKVNSNKLELLITIVNRQKAEFYTDLIQSFDVNMQLVAKARGTATLEMLDLLGLEDNKKAVIFSIIKEEKVKDALHTLDIKFKAIKNGNGIAYTVPLSSMIGVAIYGFLSNNKMTVKE